MTTLQAASVAITEIRRRREARNDVLAFARYTMPAYRVSPHLTLLAGALNRIEQGELKRLIVIMPPRHGKSEMVSVRFPTWYLGRHPTASIVQSGYAAEIALEKSRTARNVFVSPEMRVLFPDVRHKPGRAAQEAVMVERQAANEWGTRHGGSYYAVGVGGGLTGRGFNIGIIDDPIKDAQEAESPTTRRHVWDWYTQVFRTRAEPDAAIIVVTTRWHDEDLVGRLLTAAEHGGEQWEVLHLKAIDDGEALWPERYPISALEAIKATIGSHAFTSLFQGDPVVAAGNIIKREWFRYYRTEPDFLRIINSWDTAFKAGSENDPSAGGVWGEAENGYYLLDVFNETVEFPELKRVAKSMHDASRSIALLVEDAASGQSLIQEFQRDTRLPILPIKVSGDKTSRANAVAPLFEAGRIYVPEDAPWVYEYIEQMCRFPAGAHDDMMDMTTQALQWFTIPEEQEGTLFYDTMAEVGDIDLW